MWAILDSAIDILERDRDLELKAARSHVIGYLCQRLAEVGFNVEATTASLWRILEHAPEFARATMAERIAYAGMVEGIARAGTERHVADFLRSAAARTRATPGNVDEFMALAGKLIAACPRHDDDFGAAG